MAKYTLLNGIWLNDQIIPRGEVVELTDDQAKAFGDKYVQLQTEAVKAEEEAAKPKQIVGDVVEEFTLNGFSYKKLDTDEGSRYVQSSGDGFVEIDETAFVNAHQVYVAEETAPEVAQDTPQTETDHPTVSAGVNLE